jgi:hypothetical protein
VRDIDARSLTERLGDLIGCLDSSIAVSERTNPFRDRLRVANWRECQRKPFHLVLQDNP